MFKALKMQMKNSNENFFVIFLCFSFYSEREGSKNFRNAKKNGENFLACIFGHGWGEW